MITPDKVHLRDYSKIYTGSNQEGGYENPFFGFTTDTVEIEFRTDKSTYFHYPHTATQVKLVSTDIIESGAFAGSIPYKADRIFKKQADYKNDTAWGNATPENLQKGTWLCAWLSGNDSNLSAMPVWMDRWFKPGYLDSTQSMFMCSTSAIYDEPSQFTFDPGCLYRYDHIGSVFNFEIVDKINNLKIHLDDWQETTIDKSGNNNNASLANYTGDMIGPGVNPPEYPEDIALQLNGNREFASVLYSKTFDVSGTITCNAWVKTNDWRHPQTQHFISNGLRGGWSIGLNNGFFTPMVTMLDKQGDIIFMNQTGDIYVDKVLPGISNPVKAIRDPELYTWVLDNGTYNSKKHLYKIDYNGNIENAVEFPTTIDLYDFVVDGDNNAWVLTNQPLASCFNTYGILLSTTPLNGTRLTVNSANMLSAFNALDVCVMDDSRYYWAVTSDGDIHLNNEPFMIGVSATNIQCPVGMNVYALYDQNKIMKIEGTVDQLTDTVTYAFALSAELPDTLDANISGGNIFFTNEYENGTSTDYLWITQPSAGYVYKCTTDLQIIKKINLTYIENTLIDSAVLGDSAGYDWHRLFNYSRLKVPGMAQIEATAYTGTGTPILTAQKYTTSIPVSTLSVNDWHMFTFTVDTENHELRLYMDMILRDTQSIPISDGIYYKYETPLTLGANIGRIVPLDEELNRIDKTYFIGSIDDVKVYTGVLSNSDIRHIYLTKFIFKNLLWDMPTGTQSYVEEIVRFFKFKMPGQKSQFYNIRLSGLQITDLDIRVMIEGIIKDSIKKIAPLYTTLYKIIWE